MKTSHSIFLYILAVAVALACVAIIVFWAPDAHASGNGTSPYKPVIPDALRQLTLLP